MEAAASQGGIEAARALYQRLLRVPPAGGDLFRCIIQLEKDQLVAASGGSSSADGQQQSSTSADNVVRGLYEAAVENYGADDDSIWLDYAKFELERGRGVGKLYWRATKALNFPEAFVLQYRSTIGLQ